MEVHLSKSVDPKLWYWEYLWRNVSQGSLKCCSDTVAAMHYITPEVMAQLEFLLYRLHPFGLEKNLTETLPNKLSLDRIIEKSDARSFAKNYRGHKITHNIDADEKY